MASLDPLPRRTFLGLAAALASACAGRPSPGAPASLSSAEPWEAARNQFPLTRDYVHLASFLLVSHPKPVADAIERHRRALDANPALVLEQEFTDRKHTSRVRDAVARYIGGSPNDIALTDSTTMGLGTLYNGLRLAPGDEILTTAHDHYSTHEALRLTAARTGAVVRKATLYGEPSSATEDGMTAALVGALTPRTRVVAITWVHSSTGVKTPVRRIADALARSLRPREPRERAILCVDGVHGFGVEDAAMADLGCDFFVAGCHKWLYGPRGTGIVWGRTERWREVLPTIPPFFSDAWWTNREYGGETPPVDGAVMSPGGFKAYEHYWSLPEAFSFHEEIGKKRIEARIHELNRHAKEGLAAMRNVTLHTPLSSAVSSGIVCFEVAGMKPTAVVEKLLASRIIASVTPYRPPLARLSASLVNSHADVDAALRAIRALA
ncbi:MAG TPA: aminotransferase class V-fold PLP-dependent enzyme [Labilithrix sp.]|nr:aminotransferase class V-fold PLP-dependent enzyme [Labilithrix sp.]